MTLTPPSLNFPALHASHSGIWLADGDGRVKAISKGEAIGRAAETPVIVMNAPLLGQRLGYGELSGLDLLELFAFVHPARFMVPTAAGLVKALELDVEDIRHSGESRNLLSSAPGHEGDPGFRRGDSDIEESLIPLIYRAAAHKLLATLSDPAWPEREGAWDSSQALFRLRWPWAGTIANHLKKPANPERWLFSRLPEWEEKPLRPAPRSIELDAGDVASHLDHLTGEGAEKRQGQHEYAAAAAQVFAPRAADKSPHMLLAEAGTGIGKTLGYLAPASLWAHSAGGTVWVSTYTKALQRQLSQETQRIYPNPETFKKRVVVRKGRENYLCLLNLEDALQGGFTGRPAILAHLVARWAAYSRDGDMIGGDLPGWLTTLFRQRGVAALTDRRGECVYAGCPHYRKCFIERSARDSLDADIVIANHALVMVNAARGREQNGRPTRIVFDEGHHLFDAADSMFSAALTGQETIEVRRWIMGPEGKSKGRRRGLAARLADVGSYDEEGGKAIEAAREAAEALPGEGWLGRLQEGAPWGPVEQLLGAIRALVYARDESGSADAGYGLETELTDLDGPIVEHAAKAARAMDALIKPLIVLGKRLESLIEDGPDWMDAAARARMDGALFSLGWRTDMLAAWLSLLSRIGGPADPDFVDWMAVERFEGREYDIGLRRHWLDPARPVAEVVVKPSHGVMVTSATLRDGQHWASAEIRSGARHLERGASHFAVESPFAYSSQSEVLIVTDIKRGDMAGLAGAYAQLFEAAGGGALGLFTAIRRLRSVHGRIADRLAEAGLPLYAQHVDPIDTGTLVDIFRDDPRACLLGTDALRDGVDVPGHSLRLVVMEGVPWPKPNILHRARKLYFTSQQQFADGDEADTAPLKTSSSAYDDMIIRGRLAQAFGRLIRSRSDRGQFVMLSAAFPSRLLTAFPEGTPIRRVTLAEALQSVRSGLSMDTQPLDDSLPI